MDFVEIRLDYYKKRKNNLVKELTEKSEKIRNRAEFVRQVVNEEFIIFKRKKAAIEAELCQKKFQKVDETYDYLLKIPTDQYTEEAIAKLTLECKNLTKELEILKSISHTSMWKTDVLKC